MEMTEQARMDLDRRRFVALVLGAAASASFVRGAYAEGDPLPSWSEGAPKKAVLDFVKTTTETGNSKFVPPEERIACFDQDGTLWVEQPIYTQLVYCFDRVATVVKAKPALASQEPFRTVLTGDRARIAHLSTNDLVKIVAATLTGMDVEVFGDDVAKWIAEARDTRWKRPYTDLVYLPQLELMRLLRANGYKTYIVTGGGQDFVRAYAERVYEIPPEQVVGTAGGVTYQVDAAGKPVLIEEAQAASQRRQGGKARRHPSRHRPTAALRLRQLRGRPGHVRVYHRGRRGAHGHAAPA